MSWLSRTLNVVRRRVNADLDEEFEFHLAARTEELVRHGMTRDEAWAHARRQFGNALLFRDTSRDIKLLPWLDGVLQDVRFGLRVLLKSGPVTAAAVLSLSLAIGACAGAFSLIDALVLRPLPVSAPERLVYAAYRTAGDSAGDEWFNYPLFARMREAGRGEIQLFGMSGQPRRDAVFDDSGGQTEKVYAQWVSGDAMPLLGVKPALGRLLTASDDVTPGRHPVAVLSHDFWSRRFGRDPAVLGRWVTLREKALQIVGVAEPGFTGVEPGIVTDVWAPNMMWDEGALSEPGWSWFRVWGRLRPGIRAERAQAVLQSVFTSFRQERAAGFPADMPPDQVARYISAPLLLRPAANGPSGLRQSFERPLWILGLVALLVLLIACSNVASLLVARTAARGREMALRVSIGAGRARLVQQVLIESLLLSAASCVIAAFIAVSAAGTIASLLSTSNTVVRLDSSLDWRLLAFLGCAGSVVTVLFGLAPALVASTVSPHGALKAGGGRQSRRLGVFRPLVAVQVAFSFVVLFLGVLMLTSFARLVRTDLGFEANGLVIASVEARELRDGGPEALQLWRQLLYRLGEMPSVQSASLSGWGLFGGSTSTRSVRFAGRPVEAFEPYYLPVSPGFLETMRIRVLAGRDVEWHDVRLAGDSAVVVNETFVKRYLADESPIGQRFSYVERDNALVTQEIVGVAQDAKYASVRDPAPPTVYLPQWPPGWVALQLRTSLEPSALAMRLREELPRVHPAFRLAGLTLQSTLVDNTLVRERLLALLSGFFAVVAMVLVGVGLYGVLSYSVVQRTREIGVRLALGARPFAIVGLVVSQVGLVTAVGLSVGVVGGVVCSRLVTTLLYEVTPSNAWSLAGPLTCLLLACALSSVVPALRATRVDPVTALRCE